MTVFAAMPHAGLKRSLSEERCRVLHLEDSELDAELVAAHLAHAGFAPECIRVETCDAFTEALRSGSFDIILADYSLPGFDGLSALAVARDLAPDTPFIFVSGTLGEEASVEAMKDGAADYVVKQRLGRLPVAVGRALREARTRVARDRVEAALAESEARLRLALEAAALGTWDFDPQTGALTWSDRCKALFGLPPDAAVDYDTFLRGLHPQDRAAADQAVQRALDPGGSGEYDIEYRTIGIEDGIERWIAARGRAVFEGARAVRFIGTVCDITERKRAEAELAASEARWHGLFEHMHEGCFLGEVVYGPDGKAVDLRFLSVNAAFERQTGLPPAVVGRLVTEAVPGIEPFWIETCARVAESGEPAHLEYYAAPLGRWFEARAYRTEPGRCATLFLDVTERRQAQEALARYCDEMERLVEDRTAALLRAAEERRRAEEAMRQGEKLAALGQLTGGVAHDFNNLLQVVTSGASLLRRPSLPEAKRAEILEGMIQACQSARELTTRLLAFARRQTLRPEVIDVGARLAGMAELLRQTLGSRIRVETDVEPGLWPVCVDASQFEVGIVNLAVNARDAMPEGGTIIIQARNTRLEAAPERAAGEYVCIAVKDSGKGMPPHILSRVLEPFFTTKEAGLGTGLGLPQVLGFARQSGGDLHIESEPGKGTVVFLYLPRAAAGSKTAEPPAERRPHVLQGIGRTVLVVEDNPDVAAFACSLLEELGYATKRAGSAAEALALLAEGQPVDVVFSDVVMPGGISGIKLAEMLRSSHPHLPMVLATGYSEQLARNGAPEGIETLGKPYEMDELAAALGRALARGRAAAETAG